MRGARQVGRTTAVRRLAESFETFVEINLETDNEVRKYIEQSFDIQGLVALIEIRYGKRIVPGKTLLYLYETGLNLADWINDEPAKFVNRGKLAEMFVAHELKKTGSPLDNNQLYYWHRENGTGKVEVDFVAQHRNAPLPIEVKSGIRWSMKILRILMNEKSFKLGVRTSEENLGTLDDGRIRIVPLYLIGEYESILRTRPSENLG